MKRSLRALGLLLVSCAAPAPPARPPGPPPGVTPPSAALSPELAELVARTGQQPRLESAMGYYGAPIAWSGDRRWIAREGFEQVVVSDTATSMPHLVVDGLVAALSRDGGRIVVKGNDYRLYVIETASGRVLRHYDGETDTEVHPFAPYLDPPFALTFSPDDTSFASVEGRRVELFGTARDDRRVLGYGAAPLAFSRDGRRLACNGHGWVLADGSVWFGTVPHSETLFDDEGTSQELPPPEVEATYQKNVLALTPDAKLLIATDFDEKPGIVLRRIDDGSFRRVAAPAMPTAADVRPSGGLAAVAVDKLALLDLETQKLTLRNEALSAGRSVAFASDRSLRFVDRTGAVRTLDLTTRTVEQATPQLPARVTAFEFGAAGAVVFGTAHGEIVEWSLRTGRVRKLASSDRPVSALAIRDGRILAGHDDGTLLLFGPGKERRVLPKHTQQILGVAIDAAGRRAISHSEDGVARAVALGSGAVDKTWTSAQPESTRISPDGRHLAIVSKLDKDRFLASLELVSLDVPWTSTTLDVKTHLVGAIAISGENPLVVARVPGAARERFVVWHPKPVADAHDFLGSPAHQGPDDHAVSPDGAWLAVPEENARVALWSVRDGRYAAGFEGQPWTVRGLRFSADGRWLAGIVSERLWLWRTADRKLVAELSVTVGGDTACAITPDGDGEILGTSPGCAVCRIGLHVVPAKSCTPRLKHGLVASLAGASP